LIALFTLDVSTNDLAVEGKGLKDQVEPAVILVREQQANVEPIIVLDFAANHGIGAMRRRGRDRS
jgi:hypothetical protein